MGGKNCGKKSEDTPTNFYIRNLFHFQRTSHSLTCTTNNPDTRLCAQCITSILFPNARQHTIGLHLIQKTEQIPDGFLSFKKKKERKREVCSGVHEQTLLD